MSQCRYEEFIDELRAGRFHGVFIDDTGSPGLGIPGSRLHPERKSWVAIIVPPDATAEVLEEMPRAIEELKLVTGATEFHFTDIYAGRKQFKRAELGIRLSLFKFMAYIFSVYKFPIIVQTMDPVNIKELRRRVNLPEQISHFDLDRPNDIALLFLLMRVKWYLEKKLACARVFVDEGYRKHGAVIHLPSFQHSFVDGLVCFARSDIVLPIQLADFAAFCLNRTQLILAKSEMNDLDRSLREILSPIAWNYRNIPKVVTPG